MIHLTYASNGYFVRTFRDYARPAFLKDSSNQITDFHYLRRRLVLAVTIRSTWASMRRLILLSAKKGIGSPRSRRWAKNLICPKFIEFSCLINWYIPIITFTQQFCTTFGKKRRAPKGPPDRLVSDDYHLIAIVSASTSGRVGTVTVSKPFSKLALACVRSRLSS